jgi:hypothetical protein
MTAADAADATNCYGVHARARDADNAGCVCCVCRYALAAPGPGAGLGGRTVRCVKDGARNSSSLSLFAPPVGVHAQRAARVLEAA